MGIHKTNSRERIGDVLRSLREPDSQEYFAAKLGMHRTYYSAIERGEKNLTLKTLERIAYEHGVSAWEILNRAEV